MAKADTDTSDPIPPPLTPAELIAILQSGVTPEWLESIQHQGSGPAARRALDNPEFASFDNDPAYERDRDVGPNFLDVINRRGGVFDASVPLNIAHIQDRRPGQDTRPPWEIAFDALEANTENASKWWQGRRPNASGIVADYGSGQQPLPE